MMLPLFIKCLLSLRAGLQEGEQGQCGRGGDKLVGHSWPPPSSSLQQTVPWHLSSCCCLHRTSHKLRWGLRTGQVTGEPQASCLSTRRGGPGPAH